MCIEFLCCSITNDKSNSLLKEVTAQPWLRWLGTGLLRGQPGFDSWPEVIKNVYIQYIGSHRSAHFKRAMVIQSLPQPTCSPIPI